MKVSGTGPHVPQARTTANSDRAVRMAMAVKAKEAQKAEGEAALKLIESRPDPAPPPRDDVAGSRVDRYA